MQKLVDPGDPVYKRTLDHINTAVALLNDHLRVIYINPACEMLLETGARRAQGKLLSTWITGPSFFFERLETVLNTEHPVTERELKLNFNMTRKLTVDCTIATISEPRREKEVLLEFVSLDRQLRFSREEQLRSQQRSMQSLLKGLSHEIRNPLGGIRGAAQLLDRELIRKDLHEYTQVIIDEADRLKNLVTRMLSPNTAPKKRSISIHEVLERVRALIQAEYPDVLLVRDYDPSIPPIHADPEQLIQAVLNLVKNSAEATQGKGEIIMRTRSHRQITVGSTCHKLAACIEIVDTGPGIPEDIRDKIFFPMITSKPSGTGLGLSIAQAIINHHGGLIECSSTPENTKFQISLPLLEKDNEIKS